MNNSSESMNKPASIGCTGTDRRDGERRNATRQRLIPRLINLLKQLLENPQNGRP